MLNLSGSDVEVFITAANEDLVLKDSSGNIAVTGTVDGRDLATDGTKLDGIATGATNVTNTNQLTNGAGFLTSADGGNAATLDSLDSTSFLRSDADDTVSNGVTYTWASTDTEGLSFTNSSYSKSLKIGGWTSSNTAGVSRIRNSNDNLHLDAGSAGHLYLNNYCTGNVYIRGSVAWHAGNDGSGSGLDADTLDSLDSTQFLRSDASDTMTGSLTIGDGSAQTELLIKKADNNDSDHIQFYNGTTRVGEIGCHDGTWLRINQETANNIYTPRYIRADGGFFVDGTAIGINGSGNYIGGSVSATSVSSSGNITTSGVTITSTTVSATSFTATSDLAKKENLEAVDDALSKVQTLTGYTYDMKEDGSRKAGLIAQDVEKVLPEAVDGEEGEKTLDYSATIALLVNALKEQQQQIEELKEKYDTR